MIWAFAHGVVNTLTLAGVVFVTMRLALWVERRGRSKDMQRIATVLEETFKPTVNPADERRYIRLEVPDVYTESEYDEFWVKVVELAEDTYRAKEATTDEDSIIWVTGGGRVLS